VATDGEVLLRVNVGFYLSILHSHSRCSGDAFIPNAVAASWHTTQVKMVVLGALVMHQNIKWEGSTEELDAQLVLAPNRGCGHETLIVESTTTLLTATGVTQY
jgi:hypothetical protein